MARVPRFVQLRRVSPGVWAVTAWVVTTAWALWNARASVYVPPQPRVPLSADPTAVPGFRILGITDELPAYSCATVLVLVGSVLLRRMPRTALGLLLLGSGTGSVLLHSAMPMMLAFLPADIALWSLADRGPRRTSGIALAMAATAWAAYAVALPMLTAAGTLGPVPAADLHQDFFATDAVIILSGLVFWLAGVSGRQARAHGLSLAAEAATAERLRLSRDLHDSVAHDMGIIAVLAGAAVRVLGTRPEDAREALTGIETTSRDTLSGLQQMLRTLRNAEPGSDPGLLDVERLAARATGAGVRVELSWSGERRTLPAEVDRSAYRIIQEAVTNVVRHSGTTACRVAVGFEPDALAIEITDDGRARAGNGASAGDRRPGDRAAGGRTGDGRTADDQTVDDYVVDGRTAGDRAFGGRSPEAVLGSHGGFGLLGMRERVTMLSGQFSAGPRPEGGFRVAARLPV